MAAENEAARMVATKESFIFWSVEQKVFHCDVQDVHVPQNCARGSLRRHHKISTARNYRLRESTVGQPAISEPIIGHVTSNLAPEAVSVTITTATQTATCAISGHVTVKFLACPFLVS